MSALTPKADDQHGVKRLVPRRNGHQMGTWAELGTIEAGRIRPNLLIRIGGQGRADSRSESGARQFGREDELHAGAKPVCPKGEVQDAPSQPTGAQRGQESAHADSTHKFAGSEFGYAKHTPRLQRKNGLNQSTTDTRIFSIQLRLSTEFLIRLYALI